MSYGTKGRRKSLEPDPTVIPSTNPLGLLGRLPFKLGGTLRYKPSAADLQEHLGAMRNEFRDDEGDPLFGDEHSESEGRKRKGHTRKRSSTASSGETSDSFRSRGDLFPSDGEDDAVPLDDEFAMVLENRMQSTGPDDRSSGKVRSSKGKRPAGSRALSRNLSRTTQSSQSRPSLEGQRGNSATSITETGVASPLVLETPSLMDLYQEEERVRIAEDAEVERKRHAAARLAVQRGLSMIRSPEFDESVSEPKQEAPLVEDIEQPSPDFPDLNGISSKPPPAGPPKIPRMEGSSDGKKSKDFVPAKLPNFG
jgi:hypothetical protein